MAYIQSNFQIAAREKTNAIVFITCENKMKLCQLKFIFQNIISYETYLSVCDK